MEKNFFFFSHRINPVAFDRLGLLLLKFQRTLTNRLMVE